MKERLTSAVMSVVFLVIEIGLSFLDCGYECGFLGN